MSKKPGILVAPVLNWAAGLRFPRLFLLAAAVFLVDLVVPDLIPFVDEILFGLATLVLGSLRRRREARGADDLNDPALPPKSGPTDVTPG